MTFILNLAIGIIFVFLVFSLVVSAANELVLSLWKRREQLLKEGIGELLHDRHFLSNACDLYAHPLIGAMSRSEKGQPNYIPKQTFISALLDLVSPANAGVPRTLEQIRAAIQKLAPGGVKSLQEGVTKWDGPAETKTALSDALASIDEVDVRKQPIVDAIEALTKKRLSALALVEKRADVDTDPALKAELDGYLATLEGRTDEAATATAAKIRAALPPSPSTDTALKEGLLTMVSLLWDKDFEVQYQKLGAIGSAAQLGSQRAVLEAFVSEANPAAKHYPWTWKAGVGVAVLLFVLVVAEWWADPFTRELFRVAAVVLGAATSFVWHWLQKKEPAVAAAATKVWLATEIQLYLSRQKLSASLTALLDDAGHDLDSFKARVGDWFDNSMRRVTGWYKNQTQFYLFALGLILAGAANVDAIHIMRYLAKDPVATANFADAIVQATAPARQKEEAYKAAKDTWEPHQARYKELEDKSTRSAEEEEEFKGLRANKAAVDNAEAELNRALRALTGTAPPPDTAATATAPAGAAPAGTPAPKALQTAQADAKAIADSMRQAISSVGGTSIPMGWGAAERSYFLAELTADEKTSKAAEIKAAKADPHWKPDFWQRLVIKLLPDDANKDLSLNFRVDRSHCFSAILGFVLTALAGSLGAPFWFDTLNKVITVRSAGKKPEEQPTNEKKTDADH